jgi:hypothetical protein
MRSRRARFPLPLLGVLLTLVGFRSGGADPLPVVSPPSPTTVSDRLVRTRLDVRLDPTRKTISGEEIISWTNPSFDPVPELRFHLFLNAFRNEKSTFLRESRGIFRSGQKGENGWGAIDILQLVDGAGHDLGRGARFDAPDDGNTEDRTVWVVPLPEPVPPGGSIELRLRFVSILPEIFARTGYVEDFFLAGQWFPKLGVFEPAGTRGRSASGWNCHQFHALSEFYGEYGTYDVTLRYPSRFVVGATGQCRSTRDEGKERISRFVAEDVHDFAFVAWPRFVVVQERFDPEKDLPPEWLAEAKRSLGLSREDLALTPVDITYLEVPGREAHRERQIAAIKGTLASMGLRFGAYPWPTLTVVDVPRGADEAGGMEYSTFVTTAGLSIWNGRGPLSFLKIGEITTVHEIVHNTFYGLVGSNEFEESWLDEGLTTWATDVIMADLERLRPSRSPFASIFGGQDPRFGFNALPDQDPLKAEAWRFATSESYFVSSYAKTASFLDHLRATVGPDRFDRALRAYATRWRFRHPSGDDLRSVLEEYAGRSLETEWNGIVLGREFLDHAVGEFDVWKVDEEGIREGADGRAEPEGPDAKKKGEESPKKDSSRPELWRSRILVRNRGTLVAPTTIRFVFRQGSKEQYLDRSWDGRGGWIRFTVTAAWKLDRVEVDPGKKNALDVDRTNDGRVAEGSPFPALRLGRWLLVGLLALLGGAGGILL